jgi:DNA-binding NarL/FixJ family response regulator
MAGNSILSPEITAKVLQTVRRLQGDHHHGFLSEREIEVLKWLAKGQTTAQIASVLFISENTVKTHIRHILEKMEVNNRAEAVARAALLNLI